MNYRALLVVLGGALFLAACGGGEGGGDADAGAIDAALPAGTVATESGLVVGQESDGLWIFRGIPYAAPPVGDLRLRPPEPHPGWTEPLAADTFGAICPQRERGGNTVVGDEDCLTLNIWTHVAAGPRPVMVFIHGGAFVQGAGSFDLYEASNLATAGDVVVVTINYRLGAFGYLALEELAAESGDGSAGNYGLLDQITALEWVQRNIAGFGGDPGNVTIFGESAGGKSICAHLGSAPSADLFHGAIVESGGGCFGFPDLRVMQNGRRPAIEIGEELVAAAGCDGAGDVLSCVRGLTATELVDATYAIGQSGLGLPDLGPNLDGVLLTADPWTLFAQGQGNEVPVIIGSNADEATIFTLTTPVPTEGIYESLVTNLFGPVAPAILQLYPANAYATPKDAYNTLFSDVGFICPALSFAGVASGGAAPSYTYHFTQTVSEAEQLGAFHGLELFYLFGNYDTYTPQEGDLRLSQAMQEAWSAFAHGLGPQLSPPWPGYDPLDPGIALLADPVEVVAEIREGRCAELQALGVIP